jgi:hypothetical protein
VRGFGKEARRIAHFEEKILSDLGVNTKFLHAKILKIKDKKSICFRY